MTEFGEGACAEAAHTNWSAREVSAFVGLTFGTTWALHIALALTGESFSLESPTTALLYLPGLLAPSAAAFVIEARRGGRDGIRQLAALAQRARCRRAQLLVAVAAPLALTALALAASGGSATVHLEPAMAIGQVWVVAGEEFGWRGWLWPRAADRFGPTRGTALVTAIWGLWHLPMFAVAASPQAQDGALAFAAAIAAWGAIHGALQLGSRSVLTAMVFHAVANITVSTVNVDRPARTAVYAEAAALTLWWLHSRSRSAAERR